MLAAIGGVGLVLFMFLVGLELDWGTTRRHRRTVASVSIGSLTAPLVCGVLLAFSLYSSHGTVAGHPIPKAGFVLFVSLAVSVTAFPVLARMLVDHDLASADIGVIAMASAAIQDLAGWLLLAVALAVVAGIGPISVLWKAGMVGGLMSTLFIVGRPGLRWMLRRIGDLDGGDTLRLTLVLGLVAACAGLTQVIGLHAVIGAFIVGVAFPRDCAANVMPAIRRAVWPLTMSMLLPVYFIGPGLNFDLGSIATGPAGQLLLIVGVSCFSKVAGTLAGARTSGLPWRDSAVIGVLLNTRGLVELIILNIGFNAGILDKALYSQLVLMALAATFLTSPMLRIFARDVRRPFVESPAVEHRVTVGR